MSEKDYIVDLPLPENQNFERLKKKGLLYLHELAGNNWTNFNDSDPGVTILDQLCYALTELGYCNDFLIEDILTRNDGKIDFENQFFLPDQILTNAPITAEDYRKLVIDAIPQVENVLIETINPKESSINGIYQVYLLVQSASLTQENAKDCPNYVECKKRLIEGECEKCLVETEAYNLLNKFRNIAEIFLMPKVLENVPFTIKAQIKFENDIPLDEVLSRIRREIENYIWPTLKQYGYSDLEESGKETNEIFNGPLLKNGWIPSEELEAPKRDNIRAIDISWIISAIEGVKSVRGLKLRKINKSILGSDCDEITTLSCQIAEFDLSKMMFQSNGNTSGSKSIFLESNIPIIDVIRTGSMYLNDLRTLNASASIGASLDLLPDKPTGKYRDIEDYYSIQNTFPDIYTVGRDALRANASEYRIAQSRQLKGYLMIFDQLLANQFSQLANVTQLFSFKQAVTIPPFGKENPLYPVPYQKLCPTYFGQPLYNVPHVRPLLAGNDIFKFHIQTESQAELEEKSWKKYKEDPYNKYNYGLTRLLEDDDEAEDRRNRMLDHLLARHGESANLYDEGIAPRWSGDAVKTRIITKGIVLQNYLSLSYNRQKSFDFLSASAINPPNVPNSSTNPGNEPGTDPNYFNLYRDFQLDVEKLEKLQKLKPSDFTDFSTFELKLNILLGLRQRYYLLISILEDLLADNTWRNWIKKRAERRIWMMVGTTAKKIAWRIAKRRIARTGAWRMARRIARSRRIAERRFFYGSLGICVEIIHIPENKKDVIVLDHQPLLEIVLNHAKTAATTFKLYREHAEQLKWLADERKGFLLLETILLLQLEKFIIYLENSFFYLSTVMIFPGYVNFVNNAQFKSNLEGLMDKDWPAHVKNHVLSVSFDSLKNIIPVFVDWRNSLRYDQQNDQEGDILSRSANELIGIVTELSENAEWTERSAL